MRIVVSTRSLRGEIINKAILGEKYQSFDYTIDKYTPRLAEFNNNKFICLLCKRMFKDFRQIKYHIAVMHKIEVTKIENNIRRLKLWWR